MILKKYYVYYDKKKNSYWIKYEMEGKRSSIYRNPNTKKRFATEKEAILFAEHELFVVEAPITFDELYHKYVKKVGLNTSSSADKLMSWYKNQIKSRIGQKHAKDISEEDLVDLMHEMKEKKLSEKYINKQINNIKTVLNYGVKNKYLTENPVKGFKTLRVVKNSEDVKYWSPDQIKYMLSKIDDKFTKTDTQYIKYLFTFAYFTGFRKGEIMALKWKNIDFNEKKITVDYHINEKGEIIKGRKNGNGYSISVDNNTYTLLLMMKDYFYSNYGSNIESYVFPSLNKGPSAFLGHHTPTRWVEQMASYCDLPNITFHGFRHSAVVYWIHLGIDSWRIAQRIGDTVEMVNRVYGDIMDQNQKKTVEIINEHSSDFDTVFEKYLK